VLIIGYLPHLLVDKAVNVGDGHRIIHFKFESFHHGARLASPRIHELQLYLVVVTEQQQGIDMVSSSDKGVFSCTIHHLLTAR